MLGLLLRAQKPADPKAGIEYVGQAGFSSGCQNAVMRLLQYREQISHVRILTAGNHHGLLLTVNERAPGEGDLVAVKTGFASGYGGAGPKAFSYVLQLLDAHDAEISEYNVKQEVLDRLDNSALQKADVANLKGQTRAEPGAWQDYILHNDFENYRLKTLWQEFRPVIPFAIVDPRIIDLAMSFWEDPDARLNDGYRRLEDLVRKRIRSEEIGQRLFSAAFNNRTGVLIWEDLPETETTGRMNLFTGTFMAFRNPRAHKETKTRTNEHLSEFLLLNLLYTLECHATESNRDDNQERPTQGPLTP